ncbi:winged helix-turn-helix transcriptional regulator [Jeotgalibacillus aurantiacus]|uniref:winged helix-turn-helix transcriptional regulator n=1 Tax=Jeotgalibacillus aurantiacus TaxID=2763266 RepID=UPI001D0A4D92|nr:helix-turn-helix domain-containing protein [Jeotgalibacillus aurantiacus]
MAEFHYREEVFSCPVQLSMNVIMGKWKVLVLWHLMGKNRRYGELKRLIDGISHKVLSETLKSLEEEAFILRIDHHENPPHVEYEMTEKGRELQEILVALQQWGLKYKTETV